MQVDERRACPQCGAENPERAGFCWQCYTPFAAQAAQPVQPPPPPNIARGGWGPTGTPAPLAPAPAPNDSGTKSRTALRIVVGVVVALLVSGTVRHFLAPSYHVPEAIGARTRMHDQTAQQFEKDMADEGDKADVELEAAVYGISGAPDVFLVIANGKAIESTDQLFESFLGGMESSGATIKRSETVTGSHGDAEYRCLPVRAGAQQIAACMWREDASVGLTLDATPEGDLTAALVESYDASH